MVFGVRKFVLTVEWFRCVVTFLEISSCWFVAHTLLSMYISVLCTVIDYRSVTS